MMDSDYRAILVEQGISDIDALKEVCSIVDRLKLKGDLLGAIKRHNPDLVILDVHSPGESYLLELKKIQQEVAKPVVIFSQDDAPSTIELAVKSGVSAYVVDSMLCTRIKPILDTAVSRFKVFNRLENELQQTQEKLEERKLIDRAKGLLMKMKNINEDEAYQSLRNQSMNRGVALKVVCQQLIDTADLLQ